MSSMGLTDSVPLSEATDDSMHSVGLRHSGELPEISDEEREAFILESATRRETRQISKLSPKEVAAELQVKQPRRRKKKLKQRTFEFEIATEGIQKQRRRIGKGIKGTAEKLHYQSVVGYSKGGLGSAGSKGRPSGDIPKGRTGHKRQEERKRKNRLRLKRMRDTRKMLGKGETKEQPTGSIGQKISTSEKKALKDHRTWTLPEVTTVGSIGIGSFGNKPPQDPEKKRRRKNLSNFIRQSFKP